MYIDISFNKFYSFLFSDPKNIPDLQFDFKFDKKELDSLKKSLMFVSDVFKPRSVRKGSTMPGLPKESAN